MDSKKRKSFACEFCSCTFSVEMSLNIHKLLHTMQQSTPQQCPGCVASSLTVTTFSLSKKNFKDSNTLEEHEVEAHSDQRPNFSCNKSKNCLKTRKSLQKHRQGFHTTLYKCVICNFTFKSRSRLLVHKKFHYKGNKFACEFCNCKFFFKGSLNSHHKAVHMNSRQCPICKKSFLSMVNFQTDIGNPVSSETNLDKKHFDVIFQKKTKKSLHKCLKCSATFKTLSLLVKHKIIIHSEEKLVTCNFCNCKFFLEESIKNVIRLKQSCSFQCPNCKKLLLVSPNLQNGICAKTAVQNNAKTRSLISHQMKTHYRSNHNNMCNIENLRKPKAILISPPIELRKPLMRVDQKSKVKLEMPSTQQRPVKKSKSFPFTCLQCNAGFRTRHLLIKHEQTYSKGDLFSCEFCKCKFSFMASLKSHRTKIHKDNVVNQCPKYDENLKKPKIILVSASSPNRDSLEQEKPLVKPRKLKVKREKSSTQQRLMKKLKLFPFTCRQCNTCFRTRHLLIKHEQTHSKGDLFPCEFCDCKFSFMASLKSHLNTTHENKEKPCPKCQELSRTPQSFKFQNTLFILQKKVLDDVL